MSDYAEPEITLVYGSMYGNTEHMVRQVIEGIASENVHINVHKIPETNQSFVLADAWKSAGLVLGMPTYEYKMYPPMANLIDLFDRKHVWKKKVVRFGSFGWSGGAQKEFDEKIKNLKWDVLECLDFRGAPTSEELAKGYEMGKKLAQQIKAIPRKLI
jgi:flavorubredoxin